MTKPTPPTLRERNRYIVIELTADKPLAREDVVKTLWNTILRFLGEWHAGETGFNVMDWDTEKNKGIIRVNHKSVDSIRTALILTKEVGRTPVRPQIHGVTGTLKKARNKWL